MNSKIFIVLFFSMLGLTVNLHAQTDKQSAEEKEKQELREKFSRGMQARKMEQRRAKDNSIQVQTNKYNNREAEILEKLNTGEIPADFPSYRSEYSNEQYTILMNKWYTANPTLVKNESKNEQK